MKRFERKDGIITLQMSEEEYAELLIVLGYQLGSMSREGAIGDEGIARMVNRLNEGNDRFRPYILPAGRR